MKKAAVIPLILIICVCAGCGVSKHIKREEYRADYPRLVTATGLRCYRSPDNTFDGRLDLLYEKKIKGAADSPMLAVGDLLVFRTARDRVLVIDQATGERVARMKKRRGIVLDPVVVDSVLTLVRKSTYGEIETINLFTGSTMRKRIIRAVRSGPVTVKDKVVYGTTEGIIALNVQDLSTAWKSEAEILVAAPPATDGYAVYFTCDDNKIRAVDSDDGATLWESEYDASVVSDLSAGTLLYFGLSDGRLVAVNKKTGKTEWETPLGYQVRDGVAETESAVFIGCTDKAVYRLSRSTGNVIWRYETEGIITAPPLLYDNVVVIGSHDRHVYSISAETGQLIDRQRLEGPVSLGAVVAGNKIFLTCRKERIYCFRG